MVVDTVIPAGGAWARVLTRGQGLRIVDLEGQQAVDFLCYNAANPEERYNAADTMKYAKTIFLTRGHGIYSDRGRRLFTIVADTCGRHDTIGGCCSAESNEFRYGVKDTPSCRANFVNALAKFGLGRKDIVANINFFMNVPVEPDGAMGIVDGRSKPGDYVELRAEMDVLAVISNCPQVHNPCNGFSPTRGKVRRRVNEKGRCNLRFATRTSGATNARTEGDTAVRKKTTEMVAASSPTWETLEAFGRQSMQQFLQRL